MRISRRSSLEPSSHCGGCPRQYPITRSATTARNISQCGMLSCRKSHDGAGEQHVSNTRAWVQSTWRQERGCGRPHPYDFELVKRRYPAALGMRLQVELVASTSPSTRRRPKLRARPARSLAFHNLSSEALRFVATDTGARAALIRLAQGSEVRMRLRQLKRRGLAFESRTGIRNMRGLLARPCARKQGAEGWEHSFTGVPACHPGPGRLLNSQRESRDRASQGRM